MSASWFWAALNLFPNRHPQPLHGEFDIGGLQIPPALDLSMISVFWKSLEILFGELPSGRPLARKFLADVWVDGAHSTPNSHVFTVSNGSFTSTAAPSPKYSVVVSAVAGCANLTRAAFTVVSVPLLSLKCLNARFIGGLHNGSAEPIKVEPGAAQQKELADYYRILKDQPLTVDVCRLSLTPAGERSPRVI
jgi:hypothetical protein